MAPKNKPAKPIAGQAKKSAVLDPALYGTQILFVGSKGTTAVCPTCKRSTTRGMLRLKGNDLYCSVRCVSATIVVKESEEATEAP
jgi:hypothetical protein